MSTLAGATLLLNWGTDAAMANLSFRERYDSIVSSMLELRNEMKDDTSENEVRQLRSQLADMQSKGEELQSALEKSQQNLRQAVGDVAYFKVLLDESGKETATMA
eukprot:symbB.v1.2.005244.t1/scaffold304.1/size234131/3